MLRILGGGFHSKTPKDRAVKGRRKCRQHRGARPRGAESHSDRGLGASHRKGLQGSQPRSSRCACAFNSYLINPCDVPWVYLAFSNWLAFWVWLRFFLLNTRFIYLSCTYASTHTRLPYQFSSTYKAVFRDDGEAAIKGSNSNRVKNKFWDTV